ncbi:hypothetical protein KAH55_05270 [bacterium]|nr:hypothetical protein [bacterium]
MRVKLFLICLLMLLSSSISAKTTMTLESYNKQIFDFQLREKQLVKAQKETASMNATLRQLIQATEDETRLTKEIILELTASDSASVNKYMQAVELLAKQVAAFDLTDIENAPQSLREFQEQLQLLSMQKVAVNSDASLALARIEKALVKINLQLKFQGK